MVEFEFVGGNRKPTSQSIEKFQLFLLAGGKEVPLYQLLRDGVAMRKAETGNSFVTGLTYGKLFVGQSGFGIPKRYHSFYFRFQEKGDIVTIRPFSFSENSPAPLGDFYFKGVIKFLKKSEAAELLDEGSLSLKFLGYQEALPLDLIRRIISVERPKVVAPRHVRIGRRKKNPNL